MTRPAPLPSHLPREDWERIITAAGYTWGGHRREIGRARFYRAIVTTLLYQGAHLIEVCRLTRRDVCLDKANAHLALPWRGNTRVMEMHPRTRQSLRSYLAVRPAPSPAHRELDPLWVTRQGNAVLPRQIEAEVTTISRRVGILQANGQPLTPQRLRQAFGVHLYRSCRGDEALVRAYLGLRDPAAVALYAVP